jgi:hypothetical protein
MFEVTTDTATPKRPRGLRRKRTIVILFSQQEMEINLCAFDKFVFLTPYTQELSVTQSLIFVNRFFVCTEDILAS